jgi:serine protease Do
MSLRHASSFLLSLLLAVGIVAGQQAVPPPPAAPMPPSPDSSFGQAFSLFIDGGSFLGVYAEDINKETMSRYGLREARGVGITGIVKDSPAEKAGLKKDDVILRFDNENVTSVRKLNRLVSEVAPDQTVKMAISRAGAQQELAVAIGKRNDSSDALQRLQGLHGFMTPGTNVWKWEGPEADRDGPGLGFGNNRRIGVGTMPLTKQLADYFGIADGKGVLVTSVVEDSPAAKAGIRAGDVITAVDGAKVEGAGDLARAINKKKEGEVTLTVVRDKSRRTIAVTPTEGSPSGQTGTMPQVGRRILIPRIELPTIPEMNIMVPRIELPVIPEIDIQLPPRAPKARVKTPPVPRPI